MYLTWCIGHSTAWYGTVAETKGTTTLYQVLCTSKWASGIFEYFLYAVICHPRIPHATAFNFLVLRWHDRSLFRVPNAKEGRESVDFEIYGINGIPEEAYAERAAKKARTSEPTADEGSSAQEIPAADISAPRQTPAFPGQGMPHQFGGQPQIPGMMYGRPPVPGMGFNPTGQPGFPGMMGAPRPGFNPMQHGIPQMQHGGPHMPPHMFGGPRGPNSQMFGGPGGPMQGGYPPGPAGGPPGPPPRGLPIPPGPPPSNGVSQNSVGPGGPPLRAPIGPVTPLFPAGAATGQSREFLNKFLCVT